MLKKKSNAMGQWLFVGVVFVAALLYKQGQSDMWINAVVCAGMAFVGFKIVDYVLKDVAGIDGWFNALLFGIGAAFALKITGIGITAPTTVAKREFFSWIALAIVIAVPVALIVSARARETIKIAATNILFAPTPLFGAARLFGYFILGALYGIFEAQLFSARGSMSSQVGNVITVGLLLAIMYGTAGQMLIGAWQSAGRLTSLRGSFKSATNGFPKALMHRSGPWAAMAINPATRSVVLQARALINGTTANQPNELITLSFDDIADVGYVSPGYGFKGVLAGAGYQALAATAVIALNDLTQQRIAGAFDTGVWFRTRNKDVFLVQTDERDMQELAGIVGKAIF